MTSSNLASPALQRLLASRKWKDDALSHAFETGAAMTRKASVGPAKAVKSVISKFISNASRSHPTTPDRKKSVARRRKLGGSSCMPDKMREVYTEGERAVLWVVVQEIRRYGSCSKCINGIAAIAGVSRTTVQNAIRKAKDAKQKHIKVEFRPGTAGRLSETNVIRIISSFWLRWLGALGGWFKQFCPSKNKAEKLSDNEIADSLKVALERESAAAPEFQLGVSPRSTLRKDGEGWRPKSVSDGNTLTAEKKAGRMAAGGPMRTAGGWL